MGCRIGCKLGRDPSPKGLLSSALRLSALDRATTTKAGLSNSRSKPTLATRRSIQSRWNPALPPRMSRGSSSGNQDVLGLDLLGNSFLDAGGAHGSRLTMPVRGHRIIRAKAESAALRTPPLVKLSTSDMPSPRGLPGREYTCFRSSGFDPHPGTRFQRVRLAAPSRPWRTAAVDLPAQTQSAYAFTRCAQAGSGR